MKAISLLVVQVLAVIVANLAFFWAIIEFILYLVKDKVFNWWSVWTFCISVAVALICIDKQLELLRYLGSFKVEDLYDNLVKQKELLK